MSGYDPDAATVQQFIDCVIAGLTRVAPDGYGHGWHLVGLEKTADGSADLTWETPIPLMGWKPEQREPYAGPHRVFVTIAPWRPTIGDQEAGCLTVGCEWRGPVAARVYGRCPDHVRPYLAGREGTDAQTP